MFYIQLDPISEVQLPEVFTEAKSSCGCVVATLAFGLGLQVPNVKYVIHWVPPKNLLQYWQEVGRAGLGRTASTTIMYLPKYSIHKSRVTEDVLSLINNSNDKCIRQTHKTNGIRQTAFQVPCVPDSAIDSCCYSATC